MENKSMSFNVNYSSDFDNVGSFKVCPFTSIDNLINELGGKSFNHGIYRICNTKNMNNITSICEEYFPKLKNRILAFSYDWLGRVFCIQKKEPNIILLIEPGAGDALEIPGNIDRFHNEVLVQYANEALAKDFYEEWYSKTNTSPKYSTCIGYKIPLFLNGADEITNLEEIDFEVYFSICSQLWNKTRNLKSGQSIKSITIN